MVVLGADWWCEECGWNDSVKSRVGNGVVLCKGWSGCVDSGLLFPPFFILPILVFHICSSTAPSPNIQTSPSHPQVPTKPSSLQNLFHPIPFFSSPFFLSFFPPPSSFILSSAPLTHSLLSSYSQTSPLSLS